MATLSPVAGKKIYIGDGPLTVPNRDMTEADFSSVTWTEIDGWETHGEFGDQAEIITTQLINRGRDIKQKGSRNAGTMENNFAILRSDPGQIALIAAEKTTANYAFKVEDIDAPASGPAPTPTTMLFGAIVNGARETGGSANTIQMLATTLEINSNIVTVAAATGD